MNQTLLKMKPLYIYRPLIYRERRTLKEFLDENPVWKKLLDFYKSEHTFIAPNPLGTLNEARYLAVKAMLVGPEEAPFDSTYTSLDGHLCVAMAYVLLRSKGQASQRVREWFSKFLLDEDKQLYIRMLNSGLLSLKDTYIDLSPKPESPEKITRELMWWKEVTDGWDEAEIARIVQLWPFFERKAIKNIISEAAERDKAMHSDEEISAKKKEPAESPSSKYLPVTAFLDYVEKKFGADRNADARVVKEVLIALYRDSLSSEEFERVDNLGRKPPYGGSTTVHTGGGAAIINSELKDSKFHSN